MSGKATENVGNTSGCLFIVSAPSGGGKTSLVQQLLTHSEGMELSVSHTTRPMRPGEVEGENYFFVTPDVFQHMVMSDAFLEHAQVFDHHYGTSKAQIMQRLAQGIDVVLDIDWQGAQQIKRLFPEAVSVFILPPSLAILRERLIHRRQDDASVIARRMQRAQDEMRHVTEFDYVIVNDVFTQAANELMAIVQAQRLRLARQLVKQKDLLSFLLVSQ